MKLWQKLTIAGAIVLLFVLVVGVERQRNCRTADSVQCETFGIGLGKYGGPQRH